MLLPDRVAAKRERHRLENEPLARWDDGEPKGIDRRAAALDMIEARKRGSRIRDLVQETRVDDPLRLAQTKQREREVRETAQDVTAIRSDESSQKAADERSRMQDRLAHARQKPAGPYRCSPG